MASYANVHFALERLRHAAALAGREGPSVLVVGPTNAGKTSLVKLLAAYATRSSSGGGGGGGGGGGPVVVVNVDPREGLLSVPGSLTATPFASLADVEAPGGGWGSSPTSGPSPVPVKLPLAYFYGLPAPGDNGGRVYRPVVTRLALAVTSRLAEDGAARSAGCIVDTPGAISQGKDGYDMIQHIASEFSSEFFLFNIYNLCFFCCLVIYLLLYIPCSPFFSPLIISFLLLLVFRAGSISPFF